ncbi:MAG: hypothetical protein WAT20_06190 [Ferruginibacter sp.]|nr:hypothetical protein [Chitinophagaceae bacterium]
MKDDDLNDLPKWDDHEFDDEDEEGEGWKPNETKAACKAMYQQWGTVMIVLKAAFDSLQEPTDGDPLNKEMMEDHVAMIMGDAYQVAVKIKSSEAGLYTIRMENAAIIRKNAQFIKLSTNTFMLEGMMEPQHRQVIRDEIDHFRELFKTWVATFKKDEFEDEWGLFI